MYCYAVRKYDRQTWGYRCVMQSRNCALYGKIIDKQVKGRDTQD